MLNYSWRRKFIELSEGIFRELGFPPPPMLHEDSLPLAMELEVDGMKFELLHSPNEMCERLLVTGQMGEYPGGFESTVMRRMLTENLSQARHHKVCFGISPELPAIRSLYYEELNEARPELILSRMKLCARDSDDWTRRFYVDASVNISHPQEGGAFILA